jgi:hypothetical protein
MAWKDWSFERYRKEVDSLTSAHKGKVEFPDDGRIYEVDHRLQVRLAFNIGVDPRVVANPINLRALIKEFNASRQDTPDQETIAAINQLIDTEFLSEKFRPKVFKEISYYNCPSVIAVLENLSEETPIGQAQIDIGVLASIPPIANQRLHEDRYGSVLNHFAEIGKVRPPHRRFTATAWKDSDGVWRVSLLDGNTRKHIILNDYLMFVGVDFPNTVTLDITFSQNEEEANADANLLDASGASKSVTDLVNGARRMNDALGGIIVSRLNRGKSWMNVGFTTYHGTNKQFKNKEDIEGLIGVINDFYPAFTFVANDIIANNREIVNTPAGFQDNVIAAIMRFYLKYGESGVSTLRNFVERRKNHQFGERDIDSPKLHQETQAIHAILDEIEKFDDGDVNEVRYYQSKSVTGKLPRRILPNTGSDSNFKIIAGLLCYAMECSMNGKLINENLYREFLGNYPEDKDENELRALAKHKVEDYFDAFWDI